MKALIGFIYIVAASVFLFSIYSGRTVWAIASSLPLLYLLWQIFFSTDNTSSYNEAASEFEELKKRSEKILLNFDNCEFKDRSYIHEVIDERMIRAQTINLDYGKVKRRDFVGQSLLIYRHLVGDHTEEFMQPFSCSTDALKVYVLQNAITLYVDPVNRSHYFFEIEDNS